MNPLQRRTDKEKFQAGDYYTGPDRYYDQISETTVVKLHTGDYYATSTPGEMIITILGSCIAACIRDPGMGVGGMNHFLLPGDENSEENTRYGAFAMEKLINEILKLGGRRDKLEVKLFGGGNVINNSSMIGEKNTNFVRQYVKDEGLRIASEHLGGTQPRRVHYYPETGKVMMRLLRRKEDLRITEEEEAFKNKLVRTPSETGGNAELF